MSKPLRLLHVEDSEADAKLILRELRSGGYVPDAVRVENAPQMRAALLARELDLVLSDWGLPGFSALAAFELVKEHRPDLPFIIISGTIGETTAVEAMRAGVHDFMVKSNLARLAPAIERELREAALRRERRAMEQQLAMSERLASVGMLAAGVAHEVNNPLAYVLANIDFALTEWRRMEQETGRNQPEVVAALSDARTGAERIRQIVRDLKIFSRGDDGKVAPVALAAVLESSITMGWNEIRHRARLVKDFAEVPTVDGNEGRLGQVFLNLLINAAQAIPDGHADENEIRVSLSCDGNRVRASIRDTGSGMSPEVQERIFQPFFTTKPVGVGTGLGLPICLGTVRGMGGEIAVESALGQGTTFHVLLPIGQLRSAPRPFEPAVRVQGRKARILIVDDEEAVLRAMARLLGREHDVATCGDGQQAAQRLHAGEHFDLVFCDLMMPNLSGMELYAQLEAARPELARRIVFLTGGAFTAAAREFVERVPNLRFEKPFDTEELRRFVREFVKQ